MLELFDSAAKLVSHSGWILLPDDIYVTVILDLALSPRVVRSQG